MFGGSEKTARHLLAFDIGIAVPVLSVMVLADIGYTTRTFLIRINGNFNADWYICHLTSSGCVPF